MTEIRSNTNDTEPASQDIRRWSTRSVPVSMRFDYWMSVMRSALWPVTDYSGYSRDFVVDLEEAALGPLTVCEETIGRHHSRRTRQDVARTEERSYHLFLSFGEQWSFDQYGRDGRLQAGDLVLLGEGEHETEVPTGFHGLIIKCPADWLRTWLPEPDVLVGRPFYQSDRWGKALTLFVGELTPRFAVLPPLPQPLLTDQLGSLLALASGDVERRAQPRVLEAIRECVSQRSSELQLTAADVAASLRLPPAEIHRVLRAVDSTFASELVEARIRQGRELLQSRLDLSLAEIARRVGFTSAQRFVQVFQRRTGHSPSVLRRRRSSDSR